MAGHAGRRRRPIAAPIAAVLVAVVASTATAAPLQEAQRDPPALAALPPGSVETPGTNELISTPQVAGGAWGASSAVAVEDYFAAPTISADGRYVVFVQVRDAASGSEIAIRDRRRETTTVIDESPSLLRNPTISADGAWVAYVRPGASATSVGLYEVATRKRSLLPAPPNRRLSPDQPALSHDGRFVAVRAHFASLSEVMVLDRGSGSWDTVSVDVNNRPTAFTSAAAAQPAISGDGRYVAFTAVGAVAFVKDVKASNQLRQVFLRDRTGRSTSLISRSLQNQFANGPSLNPAISDDGSVVAFPSRAPDLVSQTANQVLDTYPWQVFAWSSASGAVELVSVAADGSAANGASAFAAVNADGSSIAFASSATTLVPGDSTSGPTGTSPAGAVVARQLTIAGDIFVRNRAAAATSRVSVGLGATEANGVSTYPSISATGRYVAFTSAATNLVANDRNKVALDVFVRDRPPRISIAPSLLDFGAALVGSLGTTRTATITSSGIGPARIGAIAIAGPSASDYVVASNPCTGLTLAPGATCAVSVLFVGTGRGSRVATLSVASDAGAPVVVRLTGTIGVAKLTVVPSVGPPGIVVIATGTGFPPNAPISMSWSQGINGAPISPVVSDAEGGFTAQVLVFPKDRLGERQLRATASVPGLAPVPARAKFLVVAGTGEPPISGLVQVFATSPFGEPIILRR